MKSLLKYEKQVLPSLACHKIIFLINQSLSPGMFPARLKYAESKPPIQKRLLE
jgi:hypothetical protein